MAPDTARLPAATRIGRTARRVDDLGETAAFYRDVVGLETLSESASRAVLGVADTPLLDRDAVADAAAGASTVPVGTDVGHVHLELSSLEAFSEFYVDTVGFEQQQRMRDATFVSAGGYHHHLAANTWHRRSEPASTAA